MKRTYESAAALAHRAAGPLANHLGEFVASLTDQQYVPAVVYVKALHALAFDRWLAKHRVTLTDLGESHLERFQRRRRRSHSAICAETRHRERYNLSEVLQFLRARRVCEPVEFDPVPADVFVVGFEQHLRDHQGLTPATIETYARFASQFLHERFGTGEVDLGLLCPRDPIEFVQGQAKRMGPPALKCVVSAMRSLLRYAQYRGEVAPELVAAVPAVAAWTTTPPLPRAISAVHAQRAIDSCDQSSVGLRDRAVLLLLARLGLRAHEITALCLDDCDWDAGCLRVRSKGGRESLLPMPLDVGDAIAAYLERGRPASADRRLVLCSMAPIRGFLHGSDAIGSIVRNALRRAKVDAPHSGSHQFRHALAVRMLERGASLAEIGEVLRHRSPQTTSIYARVDIGALRSLALPWPGGAR